MSNEIVVACIDDCPVCGANRQAAVIDSRLRDDGTRERRKKCLVCNARWSTIEILRDDFNTMAKGRRLYDAIEKIMNG